MEDQNQNNNLAPDQNNSGAGHAGHSYEPDNLSTPFHTPVGGRPAEPLSPAPAPESQEHAHKNSGLWKAFAIGGGVLAVAILVGSAVYLGQIQQGDQLKGQLSDADTVQENQLNFAADEPITFVPVNEETVNDQTTEEETKGVSLQSTETLPADPTTCSIDRYYAAALSVFMPQYCAPIDETNCELLQNLKNNPATYYLHPVTLSHIETALAANCLAGMNVVEVNESLTTCPPDQRLASGSKEFDPDQCVPFLYPETCDELFKLKDEADEAFLHADTIEKINSLLEDKQCMANLLQICPVDEYFDKAFATFNVDECKHVDFSNCDLLPNMVEEANRYSLAAFTVQNINSAITYCAMSSTSYVEYCPMNTYYNPSPAAESSVFNPNFCENVDLNNCALVTELLNNPEKYRLNGTSQYETLPAAKDKCQSNNQLQSNETSSSSNNQNNNNNNTNSTNNTNSNTNNTNSTPPPSTSPTPLKSSAPETTVTTMAETKVTCEKFVDVPDNDPDKAAVDYVFKKGLMTGKPGCVMDLGAFLQRDEIAKIILALDHDPNHNYCNGRIIYPDLTPQDWAYQLGCDGTDKGVIMGYTGINDPDYGFFRPNRIVKRNEFAALVVRNFLKAEGEKYHNSISYKDVPVDEWYTFAAKVFEIYKLKEGTMFYPFEEVKRREVVQVLYKLRDSIDSMYEKF